MHYFEIFRESNTKILYEEYTKLNVKFNVTALNMVTL